LSVGTEAQKIAYTAAAQFHLAMKEKAVCEETLEGFGNLIARMRVSMKLCVDAIAMLRNSEKQQQQTAGTASGALPPSPSSQSSVSNKAAALEAMKTKIENELRKIEKDNITIYHEKVPEPSEYSSLSSSDLSSVIAYSLPEGKEMIMTKIIEVCCSLTDDDNHQHRPSDLSISNLVTFIRRRQHLLMSVKIRSSINNSGIKINTAKKIAQEKISEEN
jgi:hypothetical protein